MTFEIDDASRAGELFGVYVHIPFCRHRCDYCAFATFTDRDQIMDEYLEAVRIDINRAVDRGMPLATSIFVGGGTPTRVPADGLASVIDSIPRVHGAEVTVECNPDDVSLEMFSTYESVGVNRVSIGVQSMQEHVLRTLGRSHNPSNVRTAVASARAAGIAQVNLDVIYGSSGESIDDWRGTVESIIAMEPDHVSAYGLTVEAGTPLADDPSRYPDDDLQADMYECVDDMLVAAGYHNYEVSNWARTERECVHNFTYWLQGDYLGFGSAAHSHRGGRRWWNVRTPERYIHGIRERGHGESADECLDEPERKLEGLQLLLRTRLGVPHTAFSERDLVSLGGLVERSGERVYLTRTGRLLANEVALRLRVG